MYMWCLCIMCVYIVGILQAIHLKCFVKHDQSIVRIRETSNTLIFIYRTVGYLQMCKDCIHVSLRIITTKAEFMKCPLQLVHSHT